MKNNLNIYQNLFYYDKTFEDIPSYSFVDLLWNSSSRFTVRREWAGESFAACVRSFPITFVKGEKVRKRDREREMEKHIFCHQWNDRGRAIMPRGRYQELGSRSFHESNKNHAHSSWRFRADHRNSSKSMYLCSPSEIPIRLIFLACTCSSTFSRCSNIEFFVWTNVNVDQTTELWFVSYNRRKTFTYLFLPSNNE